MSEFSPDRLKNTMKRILPFLLLVCALPSFALDLAHFNELNHQAHGFAQKQDWKSLRQTLIELGAEMPTPTPNYMLRMASVETHLGNKEEALKWMERYAATGLTYDISKDDDLKPLVGDKDYQPIAERMQAQTKAISHADLACTLPIADLMPEDLTYLADSKTFVVSSVQHHSLYRVSLPKKVGGDCTLQEIPLDASLKRWPVLAVSADNTRHVLWMTTAAFPGWVDKPEEGKTSLIAINPATGAIIKRFDLESSTPALLGDMSIGPDGTVYVSDGMNDGAVYRLRGDIKTAKLEKIASGLPSPQTPALARDGKRLFVADYALGIVVIDLATGNLSYLQHPENFGVTALDGLCLTGDSLIGIQNGTEPERIIRMRLNPEQTSITSLEVIEQSTPRLGEPTHAIDVNGTIYATGNVGWGKIDDHGKVKSGEQLTNPVLLSFPAK